MRDDDNAMAQRRCASANISKNTAEALSDRLTLSFAFGS